MCTLVVVNPGLIMTYMYMFMYSVYTCTCICIYIVCTLYMYVLYVPFDWKLIIEFSLYLLITSPSFGGYMYMYMYMHMYNWCYNVCIHVCTVLVCTGS